MDSSNTLGSSGKGGGATSSNCFASCSTSLEGERTSAFEAGGGGGGPLCVGRGDRLGFGDVGTGGGGNRTARRLRLIACRVLHIWRGG